MSSNIKVLQVIPKLGYGGAETGCYDVAHYLPEHNCKSFLITSGGELLKYVDKKKVKLIRLPVHSKNPLLIFLNAIILVGIILFFKISIVHARSRAPAWSCLLATKLTRTKFVIAEVRHNHESFKGVYKLHEFISEMHDNGFVLSMILSAKPFIADLCFQPKDDL